VFTFQPIGENAAGPSPLRFTLGDSGEAQSVVIDYFNTTGQGGFTRA
jgi:hypothetical protein